MRTPLPRRYEPAAVQDTTWPVAWTPASVREEAASFSDAGGSTRRRESAASSAPCTDSTPAFCRWKPAKPVPSYESVARYVARSAARTTASGAPDGSAAQQCARRRGRHSGGRRHRQHARMRRRQRSAVLTDTRRVGLTSSGFTTNELLFTQMQRSSSAAAAQQRRSPSRVSDEILHDLLFRRTKKTKKIQQPICVVITDVSGQDYYIRLCVVRGVSFLPIATVRR